MAQPKVTRVSPRVSSSSGFTFTRDEVNILLPQYMMIRDAIEGEMAVKGMYGSGLIFPSQSQTTFKCNINIAKAKRYLPMPNPEDQSKENLNRYMSYVQRAVYYNVMSRTLNGMAGQIFLRDPDKTLPTELDILNTDADGAGTTLDQLADKAVRDCIAYSRSGILVDYPVTDGPVTQQQVDNGEIRPVLLVYDPWQIVNWRVEIRNARRILTQLVLLEYLDSVHSDGFSMNLARQWRVLSLMPDSLGKVTHQVQIYQEGDNTGNPSGGTYTPRNAKGQTFDRIPFNFIGLETNDPAPDKPLMFDLAVLNIAHYRNSADYEESCFIAGQPTPVISGVDQQWVTEILKGKVMLGSRGSVALPTGAKMELIQAGENSMPMEAMKAKEAQMVAIGAKLVQIQKVQKTATQQIIETTSESSPLQKVSRNVSMAIEAALKIASEFVGASETDIQYKLNTDFDLTSMTADDQNAVVTQWQSAAIAFSEMRTVLRRAGTAKLDDDEAKKQIQADITDGLIPDPAASAQPQSRVPQPKQPSDVGGPQPPPRRRPGSPGTTA